MADAASHPGVRSLLARFENHNQNSETSPPSRGRSPVGSDTPGSRPLSKVRASFVAVDRVAQSPSGLRKTASGAESPARLRSPFSPGIAKNGDDLSVANEPELSRKTTQNGNLEGAESSTSSESTRNKSGNETEDRTKATAAKLEPGPLLNNKPTMAENGPIKGPAVAEVAAVVPVQRGPGKPNTKVAAPGSSPAPHAKVDSAVKHSSKSTASSAQKLPAASKTARLSKATASNATMKESGKEAPAATSQQSSRGLAKSHLTQTTTRPARSSTPSRDLSSSTAANASPASKHVTKSPMQTTRLPNSSTLPALSSTAKGHTQSRSPTRITVPGSLNRKPSTLKGSATTTTSTTASGTAAHPTRAVTPTKQALRKQGSRVSLPHPSATERPHSRVSTSGASKPLDEGFLARMMRPTASSASKTHERLDVKSPPRSKAVHDSKKPEGKTAKIAAEKVLPAERVEDKIDGRLSNSTSQLSHEKQSQVFENKTSVGDHQPAIVPTVDLETAKPTESGEVAVPVLAVSSEDISSDVADQEATEALQNENSVSEPKSEAEHEHEHEPEPEPEPQCEPEAESHQDTIENDLTAPATLLSERDSGAVDAISCHVRDTEVPASIEPVDAAASTDHQ